jgi:hypothetical protein
MQRSDDEGWAFWSFLKERLFSAQIKNKGKVQTPKLSHIAKPYVNIFYRDFSAI